MRRATPLLLIALGLVLMTQTPPAGSAAILAAFGLSFAGETPALPAAQKEAGLTEEEEDKLREEQDPAQRIEVYLGFAQARLSRFDDFRKRPSNPKYDNAGYLDKLLDEYIALNNELKNWIDYQYQRNGDMRRGLRELLERGPQQLEQLRRIRQSPNAYAATYRDSLRDAIDNLTDTLDGAAKALGDQEKKFGELKREEKAAERNAKEAAKEERKRMKEEKKLRKRERKHVPAEPDEN